MGVEQRSAKFDLTMVLIESAQGMSGVLEYNTDLFDRGTMERMARHWERLLEGVVKEAGMRIGELEILSKEERRQILEEWNGSVVEYPKEKCVHELFEEQAGRTPDAIALVFEGQQLSYRELNERANRLAHYLRKRGVGPEVRVGICVERGLEMVVGLLGILKAGGAYVPLDPQYPKERLAFMLDDSGVEVLLTQEGVIKQLPEHGVGMVYLDRQREEIARESSQDPLNGTVASNLVYVIYTSGSTGKPKGVLIDHLSLANLISWHRQTYRITPKDRVAQMAALAFDAAGWELWPYLAAGASICIPEEETRHLPERLMKWLAANQITMVFIPTPVVEKILDVSWPEPHALRAVLTGGDRLSRAPTKSFPCVLWNHYGPTENTVVTTWARIAAVEESIRPPAIGRPISNTRVYLLDQDQQPVPVGVCGELHIGGAGLARGYHHSPDLTAEKFIPDPFSGEAGGRLYKTGDLGRYLADGNIEFLGRLDDQVKIRGYRIELGEIENVIRGYEGVGEAVVVAREDEPGQKRLVGYVVWRGGHEGSVGELRGYLQGKLPEYMVPGLFVVMDKLPLTANGKLDRKALPRPEGRAAEVEYVEPRNQLEKLIAGVWQETLKVEEVGINDNFFELGGHSLLMMPVLERLRERLKRELTLVELFQYPTVSLLAEHMRGVAGTFLEGILERAKQQQPRIQDGVAVIGRVGRFPGARNIEEFWRNLEGGVESISFFSDEELIEAGVAREVLGHPNYVKARGVLGEADLFDAGFFGYSPREAEMIDPQQRIFLESAWEALEQAGYDAESYKGAIGVYAGMSPSVYVLNLMSNPELMTSTGAFQAMIGNGVDFCRRAYRTS